MQSEEKQIFNDERFLRLLRENQNKIYAYILSQVQNRNDADDIMQETTTVIWRKFDDFEPGTNFSAWAIQVARLFILRFFDNHKKSRLRFNGSIIEAIETAVEKKLDGIDHRKEALRDCLSKLDEQDINIVQMHYQDSATIKQVADVMGTPAHKMYRRVARIHHTLHYCIKKVLMPTR